MPVDKIDLSDSPEVTKNTFKNASGILSTGLFRPRKQQVTLRLDSDVLVWAKQSGTGYQSRINAALRTAMVTDMQKKRA